MEYIDKNKIKTTYLFINHQYLPASDNFTAVWPRTA